MKVSELMAQLEPYRDFDIETVVHMKVPEDELQKRTYHYPYDTYRAKLEVGDVGHADKVVSLEVEI